MTFPEQVAEYLSKLPSMRYATLLCACTHFGISKSTFTMRLTPTHFRTLRRNEQFSRFIAAVIANPTLTSREGAEILGLSGPKATNKFINAHVGISFNQYRLHISGGYYEM